jgi:3-hydroxyacyl-CoA dehydrogenase
VRGKKSSKSTIATAMSIGRRIAKVPVLVGVCYGFVGNRMLHQRGQQAEKLILEGALPHQVDKVSPTSASRWGRSRWATWPVSTSAGASARVAA